MANKTSQRTIEARERRTKAVALRKMGWSYGRISVQLGMTKSSVHKAVTKALTDAQEHLNGEADILRTQELDRLDDLQSFFWADASKGNPKANAQILKVMERRAKLLGLDAVTLQDKLFDEDLDLTVLTAEELDAYEYLRNKMAEGLSSRLQNVVEPVLAARAIVPR